VSTNLVDFFATFNGIYSNCKQRAQKLDEFDLVQVKAIPIELPNLSEEPFLYFEQATNGWVKILTLFSVIEDDDGVTFLLPHNFTDSSEFKFNEYTITSLSSLKPDDIKVNETCKAAIEPLDNGYYLINWPDCSRKIEGRHPTYSVVITCEFCDVIMPAGGPIQPAAAPYKLRRYGNRYPIPGAPGDYVSPCRRR
ncbi:unnamed protein product, partial [Candidula unifasciata]